MDVLNNNMAGDKFGQTIVLGTMQQLNILVGTQEQTLGSILINNI